MENERTEKENEWKILQMLPNAVTEELHSIAAHELRFRETVAELRLRAGAPSTVTVGERSLPLSTRLDRDALADILLAFCRGSLYAYRDQLRVGYVTPFPGVRVGVAGRAVTEGKYVSGVTDVSSLVIRFPRFVPGAGAVLLSAFRSMACRRGVLLFSPPGGGKTTALRDFVATVSSGSEALRTVVVDCRGEFSGTLPPHSRADLLVGYPKAEGIAIAVRTLSPDVVVCDEIGGKEEGSAVRAAGIGGVPLVASVHAATPEEVMRAPSVGALWREGWFGVLAGVRRTENGFDCRVYRENV